MNDKIQPHIPKEKLLAWIEFKKNAFFFISERTDQFPFLIRGYDNGRDQVYERFITCDSFEGAKETLSNLLRVYSFFR